MSISGRSFIRSEDLSAQDVPAFFNFVSDLKSQFKSSRDLSTHVELNSGCLVALMFFEPSTRTRFSFEVAAKRLGLHVITLDSAASTSLAKGETLVDTVHNICAMEPEALVVRHAGNKELNLLLRDLKTPVINAGDGTDEHPTQALLDLYTIQTKIPMKKARVLFVGDVKHSRVAHSDRRLFDRMGIEVGFCSPESLAPTDKEWSRARQFKTLSEGLEWCNVVMGLRLQQERYGDEQYVDTESYTQNYRLDFNSLSALSAQGLIMHPGPFVPEVDLSTEVLQDKRCVIHEQVRNGVYVRMGLLAEILGLRKSN